MEVVNKKAPQAFGGAEPSRHMAQSVRIRAGIRVKSAITLLTTTTDHP
jgi:hypothetical protein